MIPNLFSRKGQWCLTVSLHLGWCCPFLLQTATESRLWTELWNRELEKLQTCPSVTFRDTLRLGNRAIPVKLETSSWRETGSSQQMLHRPLGLFPVCSFWRRPFWVSAPPLFARNAHLILCKMWTFEHSSEKIAHCTVFSERLLSARQCLYVLRHVCFTICVYFHGCLIY